MPWLLPGAGGDRSKAHLISAGLAMGARHVRFSVCVDSSLGLFGIDRNGAQSTLTNVHTVGRNGNDVHIFVPH